MTRRYSNSAVYIETSALMGLRLYATDEPVGKSATQIKWDKGDKLTASDVESYDKWVQALASASELVDEFVAPAASSKPMFEFVMPVLVVNDGTLWVVGYTAEGERRVAVQADEATLFVDRKHAVKISSLVYRLSHLHVYTRKGFLRLLSKLSAPTGDLRERIFGAAIRWEFEPPQTP